MRILPSVSQPTLDTFRKEVYRPRLALLLLILLVVGGDQQIARGKEQQQQLSVKAVDDIPTSDNNIETGTSTSLLSWNRFARPFSATTGKQQDEKVKRIKLLNKPKQQDRQDKKARKVKSNKAASSFPFIQLGIQHLFRSGKDALYAIIPLHILWIIRLGGMMIEDTMVRSSVPLKRPSQSVAIHSNVLIKVSALAALASSTPSLTSPSSLSVVASILSFGHYSTLQSKDSLDDSSSSTLRMVPLRLIVLLELSATLLSLLSPLLKLRNPRLSPYLPSHIQLPSPSHSPPIVDILPLPPGLAAILSGRASEMQSRSARRGGRPMRVGVGAMMTRHGGFATPTIINGEIDETVAPQRQLLGGLQDPSRLPSELADTSGPTIGKAPRAKGLKVQVDSSWFLENVIILWGYLVGVIEYLIIALSLPTLSPTSFAPILALLSLRSQLSALAQTWTSARRSIECLEFVRRRWVSSAFRTTLANWKPDKEAEILCPICLEEIDCQSKEEVAKVGAESCSLDCGHELHAVCLVQIFLGTKQAFCPCCHDPLKATPPTTITTNFTAELPNGGAANN